MLKYWRTTLLLLALLLRLIVPVLVVAQDVDTANDTNPPIENELSPTPQESPSVTPEPSIISPTPTSDPETLPPEPTITGDILLEDDNITDNNIATDSSTVTDIENTNDADTQNDILSETSTSLIVTGDATSSASLINIINTNLTGENLDSIIVNILQNNYGKIDLSDSDKASAYGLPESDQTIDSVYTTVKSNQADVQNNIIVISETGNNSLDDTGTIQTGDALSRANLFNMINTDLTGNNGLFSIINLYGNQNGDIILPEDLRYLGKLTDLQNRNTISASYYSVTNETALIKNNIASLATTGNNQINGNGSIVTGQATSVNNVIDMVNTNVRNDRWLILQINNFGSWKGDIEGWWGNYTQSPTKTVAWIDLGPDTGNTKNEQSTDADSNSVNLENNVKAESNTGNNIIEGEKSSISTGDASSQINIFNLVNTNITGNHWYYSVVNIFNDFIGNIVFPRPDLEINVTADKNMANMGDIVTYTISFSNTGEAAAPGSIVTDRISPLAEFVSASSGGNYEDGQIAWDLGSIGPKSSGSLILTVKVKGDGNNNQVTNYTGINTDTYEPDLSDNYYGLAIVLDIASQSNEDGTVSVSPTADFPALIPSYQPMESGGQVLDSGYVLSETIRRSNPAGNGVSFGKQNSSGGSDQRSVDLSKVLPIIIAVTIPSGVGIALFLRRIRK